MILARASGIRRRQLHSIRPTSAHPVSHTRRKLRCPIVNMRDMVLYGALIQ